MRYRVWALAIVGLALTACQDQPTTEAKDSPIPPELRRQHGDVPATIDPRNLEALLSGSNVGEAVSSASEPELSTSSMVIAGPSIITNGTVGLGINPTGNLNIGSSIRSLGGTTAYGLRFLPTGAEATAPGCLCEGWGVGDLATGQQGSANVAVGGVQNLVVESFDVTPSTAISVVRAAGIFRVTHNYHPTTLTTYLYEVEVTIENISSSVRDVIYRRVMDWDIEPTPFSELVTIQRGTATAIYRTDNNGFNAGNPFSFSSFGLLNVNFVDAGPNDHGALFDFRFPNVQPGQSVKFRTFYGAANNQANALLAIGAAQIEAYSFGQTNFGGVSGEPNTFIFGFGGIGGAPVEPPNQPPVFPAPSVCGSTIPATMGGTINFGVTASDPNAANTVTLSALSKPATATFPTATGNPVSSTFNWVVNLTGNTLVSISAKDNAGTETLCNVTISVPTNRAPTADVNPGAGNEGSSLNLTAAVNDPDNDALTVVWNFGDGITETVNYPAGTTSISRAHTYANNRNYNMGTALYEAFPLTITVNDGKGGSVVSLDSVRVANVSPSLTFNPPTQTIVAGSAANFTYSYTDPGVEPGGWQIGGEWGDGNLIPTGPAVGPGTTGNLSHVFSVPGTYTVQLKVREVNEVVGGDVKSVTVIVTNRAPVVNPCGPFSGLEGAPIAVSCSATDADGDVLSYEWDFNVHGSANTASASVTYPNDGTFTANFTARDTRGGVTTVPVTINVSNVAPKATFTNTGPVNEGSSFTLTLADPTDQSPVDQAALKFQFDCGTGYQAPSGPSVSCPTNQDGPRNVRARISDDDTSVEYTATVGVSNVAPAGVFSNNGPVNEGTSFTLSLGSLTDPSSVDLAALTFAFDCGGGAGWQTAAGPTATCPTSDDGVRNVKARISDDDTSVEYSGTATVNNVLPNVTAAATASILSMLPYNHTASFTDPGADAPWTTSIAWGEGTPTNGSAGAPGNVTGAHTYGTPGTYTVKTSVTDDHGTGSASTILTVINRAPTAVIKANPAAATVECTGQNTTFTFDGSTSSDPEGFPLTHSWTHNGSPAGSTASITRSCAVGPHTVTLTVKDPHGGDHTVTYTFNVVDTTKPVVTLTVSNRELWPPNHKYVEINITKAMSDICTPTSSLVVSGYVVSNEADEADGTGDGETTGDIKVTRGSQVFLSSNASPQVQFNPFTDKLEVRAERFGTAAPRIYTIVMQVKDASGNMTEVRATVTVPHNR